MHSSFWAWVTATPVTAEQFDYAQYMSIPQLTFIDIKSIMYMLYNPGGETMKIGIAEIRNNMADALNRVAYQGERIVLERRGKGVAAIVPMDDLALLEAIEDHEDVKAARKALAEMKRKGSKPLAWDKVKKELGL